MRVRALRPVAVLPVLLLAALAVALVGCASKGTPTAPERPAATADDPFPLDPAVVHGTLDNGLHYYVRQNAKPDDRAELRLVVNAGSILEDDDQLGLAHFVEHMAFNGTENFEKQELVDYLEGIGMRFGPDLNAYTSTDETVYMLQVPTDDEEILDTAFDILKDWAGGIAFEGEEIDKERGVVVEEWRLGRGAWARIRDEQWPVIFEGSRYADRRTIGDKDILENAPWDTFRRYYRDWYRPDLMAIVAVGDFEPAAIEAEIRERFAALENPENPREREVHGVPDHDDTRIKIATDPEMTTTSVMVAWARDVRKTRTVEDYRADLVDSLYHAMMNARLDELTQQADPPYLYGFAGESRWVRTKGMYTMQAAVADGGVERGLTTLLTEARRVREHGFLPGELERAKTSLLRSYERRMEERDKQESSRFASQLVRHFLEREPLPSIERLAELAEDLVPGITLDEVNARADQWITENNRLILIGGPESDDALIPDEGTVLATFEQVEDAPVDPWVDRVKDAPLVADVPEPGGIVEERTIDDLGVTIWTLSNGARVVLKPTDFKNDQIVLRGWSPGGSSLVAHDDLTSANFASSIVRQSGLGEFDAIELSKALTGKVAYVGGWIGQTAEGISGSASPKDLETMFQLLRLQFTGTRRDEEAYAALRSQMDTVLQNQEASPSFWFGKTMTEVMTQDHPRRRPMTRETLDEVDLDRALAAWRDRFADASDFWFVLVGAFEIDDMRPLVERWMATLPATDRDETWRDEGVEPPPGVETFVVERGLEPKASVQLVFHGEADWNRQDRYAMSSMTRALSIRLREVLREDLGGVYGVRVGGGINRWPRETYSVSIGFGCDPERVDELLEATFREIEVFRTEGPPQEIVDKVRESQIRARETDLERNEWWASILEAQFINDLDPLDILRHDELTSTLTVDLVRDAAKRWVDPEQYVQGVLMPGPEASADGDTEDAADSGS